MGIAQRDTVTKISFLDFIFFFSIAAEGRDDRVRHCVISGAHKYKKHKFSVWFWELSSKHLALHNPF